MKSKLMMATAALALVVGTSGVLAQQESPRSAPAEKMAPKSPGNAPAAAPAQNSGAGHNGAAEKNEPGKNSAQGRPEPNRSQAQENRSRGETTGQAPAERREQTRDNNQPKRNEGRVEEKRDEHKTERVQDRTNQGRTNGDRQENRGETTGQGTASGRGSSVNISVENRTKIHDVIIKERSAARVDHVDFTVSVGTVVPKTVKLVTVPSTIVSIEPSWRGYEYFLVGDQIIIVNPRTMEIVAVLDA